MLVPAGMAIAGWRNVLVKPVRWMFADPPTRSIRGLVYGKSTPLSRYPNYDCLLSRGQVRVNPVFLLRLIMTWTGAVYSPSHVSGSGVSLSELNHREPASFLLPLEH